jgi:membrane protease YdiL (CAAX protease family)
VKTRGLLITAALLLLLLVAGLTPLAYASPPDPAWIEGIYDDADSDDVIVMITSAAAVTVLVLLVDLRQIPPLVGPAAQGAEDPIPTLPFFPLQSRAPPAA